MEGSSKKRAESTTDPSKIPEARKNIVVPHIVVDNATEALSFYEKAFGAEVLSKHTMPAPDGRTMHSEVKIFESLFFVVDDFPDWRGGKKSTPTALGGSSCTFHFSVEDVDAVHAKAVKAGCRSKMDPSDQFWGDRYGQVTDLFGHEWAFSTPLKGGPESWPKRDLNPPNEVKK
jgi:PhnB protein